MAWCGLFIRWFAIAVPVLAALFACAPARASAGTVGTPVAVCVARVAGGDTPASMLRRTDRFDCSTPQHRLGPGDYWVLSAPVRATADEPHVRVTSLWQDRITLHARYADGHVATHAATRADLSRRLQLGAIVQFALPPRDAPLDRLLFRVDGAANARAILTDLRIAAPADSALANVRMAAMYAAFGGLAAALLVYNLGLWLAMRLRFQLAYCAMVAALLVYALSSSGALAWLVPDIDHGARITLNHVALGLVLACAIHFGRLFFDRDDPSTFVRRAEAAAVVLAAASGPVFAALSFVSVNVAALTTSWMLVVAMLAVPSLIWRAWRTGGQVFWIFALAWSAPIVFAAARTLATLHFIASSFWLDNSTILAMAMEALLSSLAIAHRVHLLGRERDEAQHRAAAARVLADADPLTGLLNRRALLDRAIGREGPQTLHVLDIDHFKAVNETLGHDGGDEVLRVLARILRQIAPPGALIARFGGEEFCIVCDARQRFAPDDLLTLLRGTRMPFDIVVTASIGSCAGPLVSEGDWKRLYRAADGALFDAKRAGRDRSRRAAPLAALAA